LAIVGRCFGRNFWSLCSWRWWWRSKKALSEYTKFLKLLSSTDGKNGSSGFPFFGR
jgi:hypothetical protein